MRRTLLCVILLCIILIVIKFRFSNYTIEYKVNDYNIKTVYKKSRFYYEINKDNYNFNFDIYSKRKMNYTKIDNIEEIISNDIYCIYPTIKNVDTYPLCYKDKTFTDYHLIDLDLLEPYKEEKIDVEKSNKDFIYYNNLNEDEYIALWNYKGYIVMNKSSYENKIIFENDKYDNSLAILVDDTIYMANNDEDHEYTSLITLNLKNLETKKLNLGYNIDFDSYMVGRVKKNIYIFDNKYSVLYEINIKNGKTNIKANNEIGFVKYENGSFVNCSKNEYKINKIKYNIIKSNYEYHIDKATYKILNENKFIRQVINNNEIKIYNQKENDLYYLYKDSFYKYNPLYGDKKVFYNYELSFNSDNTIFVYNK